MIRTIDRPLGKLYVIGDIHGCVDELRILLRVLKFSSDDYIIFIGDYIDRGLRSREVVDEVIELSKSYQVFSLKGNHEDMIVNFLGYRGRFGGSWLKNGGEETLRSYGIVDSFDPERVFSSLPDEHIKFYRELIPGIRVDNYLFVHAGIDPLKSLEDQRAKDLFWIRENFLNNIHKLGLTVVFGHTPYQDVFVQRPFKIGIDTGLVYGNKLSCIELVEGKVFQVTSGEKKVSEKDL